MISQSVEKRAETKDAYSAEKSTCPQEDTEMRANVEGDSFAGKMEVGG